MSWVTYDGMLSLTNDDSKLCKIYLRLSNNIFFDFFSCAYISLFTFLKSLCFKDICENVKKFRTSSNTLNFFKTRILYVLSEKWKL